MRSDIRVIPLERFNAIDGKKLDIKNIVTDKAYKQILSAENNGYRLRHYELTRGAVGCFMSHTSLFKRLRDDESKEFYLIFEDDAMIQPRVIEYIKYYINNAPKDWDMIMFGVLREVISKQGKDYDKVKVWWGLFGYAVSKKGANTFLDYLNTHGKIDKQIDSMMSMMTVENRLAVYSTKIHFIGHNEEGARTDIQLPVRLAKNINPFKYDNIELFNQ
jgi:GR25 family glycosyltransferase involved in LPS biosynthesis